MILKTIHIYHLVIIGLISFVPCLARAGMEAEYKQIAGCYHSIMEAETYPLDQWQGCIDGFGHHAALYPDSSTAPRALLSKGRLLEKRGAYIQQPADYNEAITTYRELARKYRTSSLADDAYFRIGYIEWEYQSDQKSALYSFNTLLKWYPKGDMAREARAYLNKANADAAPVATGPVLKPKGHFYKGSSKSTASLKKSPVVAASPVEPLVRPSATTQTTPVTLHHIVIDPGHGGHDTGAIGKKGTKEKDITLAISKRLAALLRKELGVKVTLTRQSDKYITLGERNRITERVGADLFISIHANASTDPTQHGIQTYYLNNATDKAAQKLADRENKALGKDASELQSIISTLIQNATTDQSRLLAKSVHQSIVGTLSRQYSEVNDQGVRTALFYVLVGTKVPGILVETSYVSNLREEGRLKDGQFQSQMARAIADGIQHYSREADKLAQDL